MQITVANLKITKDGIRCDRTSVLGNPFHMKSELDRILVVKLFREYLSAVILDEEEPEIVAARIAAKYKIAISNTWKRPTSRQLVKEVNRIYQLGLEQDITLLCWCAPLTCHCYVLKNYFNWRNTFQ
jgi:Domain of unknown function (DUF4326)